MKAINPRLPSVRTISLSLLFVVIFYLAYIFYAGEQYLLSALSSLKMADWLIILCCSFANYLLRFSRWQYYLYQLNHFVATLPSFAYYLAGFSLTTTPGKAGETIRSLYLHNHGVKFSESLAAFFSERFLDVVVIACLALLMLLQFTEYQSIVISAIVTLLLMIVVFAYGHTHHLLEKLIPLLRYPFFQRPVELLAFFLTHTSQLFAFRNLVIALLLGSMAWFIQGMAFVYLLNHFNIEINLWIALGIYAASLLAGAISMVPGGVGTTEAAMAFFLIQVGVDKQSALVIPVITRIASLWFAVSLGGLSTLVLSLAGIRLHPDTKHS